jgi:hypothetical protein
LLAPSASISSHTVQESCEPVVQYGASRPKVSHKAPYWKQLICLENETNMKKIYNILTKCQSHFAFIRALSDKCFGLEIWLFVEDLSDLQSSLKRELMFCK